MQSIARDLPVVPNVEARKKPQSIPMKKLITGIVEFRRKLLPDYRKTFAKLALGQSPDTLFISCSDSRVAVNVFASTDPGDLFVIRNVGNMVPKCGCDGERTSDQSVPAAIEFALTSLNVTSIVICGHSECGAMHALTEGIEKVEGEHLKGWLKHGEDSVKELAERPEFAITLSKRNQLSQLNVLTQLNHLRTYPMVQQRLAAGTLTLHGWWFELSNADVYAYEESLGQFVIFDEIEAMRILEQLEHNAKS